MSTSDAYDHTEDHEEDDDSIYSSGPSLEADVSALSIHDLLCYIETWSGS
jgi:hypothetical protein